MLMSMLALRFIIRSLEPKTLTIFL